VVGARGRSVIPVQPPGSIRSVRRGPKCRQPVDALAFFCTVYTESESCRMILAVQTAFGSRMPLFCRVGCDATGCHGSYHRRTGCWQQWGQNATFSQRDPISSSPKKSPAFRANLAQRGSPGKFRAWTVYQFDFRNDMFASAIHVWRGGGGGRARLVGS